MSTLSRVCLITGDTAPFLIDVTLTNRHASLGCKEERKEHKAESPHKFLVIATLQACILVGDWKKLEKTKVTTHESNPLQGP